MTTLLAAMFLLFSSSLRADPLTDWVRDVLPGSNAYYCEHYPHENNPARTIYTAINEQDVTSIADLKSTFAQLDNEPAVASKLVAMIFFHHEFKFSGLGNKDFTSSLAHFEDQEVLTILSAQMTVVTEVDFRNILDRILTHRHAGSHKFTLANFALAELLFTVLDRTKPVSRTLILKHSGKDLRIIIENIEADFVTRAVVAEQDQITKGRKSGRLASLKARAAVTGKLFNMATAWGLKPQRRSEIETEKQSMGENKDTVSVTATQSYINALRSMDADFVNIALGKLMANLAAVEYGDLMTIRGLLAQDEHKHSQLANVNAEISRRLKAGLDPWVDGADNMKLLQCAQQFGVK